MPTFIPLMPEGAIIRATDPPSARPTKSRISGTASQNVTLDFPEGVAASAIWRILLPSQNRMGVLTSDDLEVVLRYTSQDASGGNVGWQVEAAIADQGDPFDDVTAASFSAVDVSTNQAYAGAIADEQENTVTLAGLFTGIDTAKNYTLFIKITRRTVGGDLVGGISLLPSFLVVQSGGSSISAPSEPAADGALIYLKGQDGKGTGITIADSSGNGHDSTAGVQVSRIFTHPIKNLSLCKFDVTPAFPDTGVVLPSECSMEILMGPQISDNNVVYGALGNDIVGLRFASGVVQVLTTVWTVIPYFRYDRTALFHMKRIDSGAQSIVKVFCDGVEIYESSAFTRPASGTTGKVIFNGTTLNWSHLRFWTSARSDASIAADAMLFNPLWSAT